MFQHTAARRRLPGRYSKKLTLSSFNTQPPEGGWSKIASTSSNTMFQHTAARRRLGDILHMFKSCVRFQHTAARRRLLIRPVQRVFSTVSTHSRPKAAGADGRAVTVGGMFQHTAARRRLFPLRLIG